MSEKYIRHNNFSCGGVITLSFNVLFLQSLMLSAKFANLHQIYFTPCIENARIFPQMHLARASEVPLSKAQKQHLNNSLEVHIQRMEIMIRLKRPLHYSNQCKNQRTDLERS